MLLLDALLAAGQSRAGLRPQDVFAATPYAGNATARTITTGVDLSSAGTSPLGQGGLVWLKTRNGFTSPAHMLFDSVRGAGSYLQTESTAASTPGFSSLGGFGTTGFSLSGSATVNAAGLTYAAWTFRRAQKFFDVVTWTGTGVQMTIPHNLGAVPGFIVVKRTDSTSHWMTHHISVPTTALLLNSTEQAAPGPYITLVNAASFGASSGLLFAEGGQYVGYVFGHDASAGGIVQCGSYTGNGSATGPTVTLGWQPQFLMIKRVDGVGSWHMFDAARGLSAAGTEPTLKANSGDAETAVEYIAPGSTGFQIKSASSEVNASGSNYIFMAVRAA